METINESRAREKSFFRSTGWPTVTDTTESLFAMFISREDADQAVEALRKNDFADEDILLLPPMRTGSRDFVYKQRTSVKLGVVIGAIAGFFLMGLVGVFLGSSQPAELGMASWIVATVVASFIGLVVGAAMGALVGIGTPRSAGKRYGFYLKEGGIVLKVHVRSHEELLLASQLLEKYKGQDITVLPDAEVRRTIIPEKKRLAYQ